MDTIEGIGIVGGIHDGTTWQRATVAVEGKAVRAERHSDSAGGQRAIEGLNAHVPHFLRTPVVIHPVTTGALGLFYDNGSGKELFVPPVGIRRRRA